MKNMNKLHALRKSKGVTLEQISDETDISFSSLSAYERGTRNPKINTIRTLAEYFDVSSDYLEGRYETEYTIKDASDIGNIIYELRSQSGLSQLQVANDLKIPASTFSGYEISVREPKLQKINEILNYFGKQLKVVDVDESEEIK